MKASKLFIAAVALFAVEQLSQAQITDIVKDYSAFETITVDKDFDVTVIPSTEYKVKISVDKPYVDYVQCYVKANSLVISVDKVPKEITKLYKGKNALKPTFNVTVWTPAFGGATLSDNVVLNSSEVFEVESMLLSLSGKAQIKNLSVQGTSVSINTAKSSMANITVDADNVVLNTSGSSSLKVNFSCDRLEISTKNSSTLSAVGETYDTNISTENSSKVNISGESSRTLTVKGAGSSNIDASALNTDVCKVTLTNSSTLSESAKSKLDVELSGNSTLLFGNDPVVNIIGIKSSTMQRR